MYTIKCKMCGGDLPAIAKGQTVTVCDFCGTQQTIPSLDNEKKANLFNRANRLRNAIEFDKAAAILESIVAEFPDEAEAYWGICLCTYGIEYIDDPRTGNKVPTCHRTCRDSILANPNFLSACELADPVARESYESEADQINKLQLAILEIVDREEPYDVFICYKEKDQLGNRTEDSVLAQELYDKLTALGLHVFFSRISLEDKVGLEYEPYIYAALYSARVMLAFGTKYEYFDAVWVKNEWGRFLEMMKANRQKHLIPCFINSDDIPAQMPKIQAQDIGKIGWIQDLSRGIMKLCGKTEGAAAPSSVPAKADITSLLKSGKVALKDGIWSKAQEAFQKVIELDAENSEAYLGDFLSRNHWSSVEEIDGCFACFEDRSWVHAVEFGGAAFKERIDQMQSKWKQDWVNCAKMMKEARKKAAIAKRLIAANDEGYIAVKKDGTVLLVHDKFQPAQHYYLNWHNVISVAAGKYEPYGELFVGIRDNGMVLLASMSLGRVQRVADTEMEQWTNIKSVSISNSHIAALTTDGHVLCVGDNTYGQCELQHWCDVTEVVAGEKFTIGLTASGNMLFAGEIESKEQILVWKDIVSITVVDREFVAFDQYGRVFSTAFGSSCMKYLRGILDVVCENLTLYFLTHKGAVYAQGIFGGAEVITLLTNSALAFASHGGFNDESGIPTLIEYGHIRKLTVRKDITLPALEEDENGRAITLFDDLDHAQGACSLNTDEYWGEEWKNACLTNKTYQALIAITDDAIAAIRSNGLLGYFPRISLHHDARRVTRYWSRLIGVAMNKHYIAGLRDTGKVLLADHYGNDCSSAVIEWPFIKQIVATDEAIVGLGSDGHIYMTGSDDHYAAATQWNGINELYSGNNYLIGITEGDTVYAVSTADDDVSKLNGIHALAIITSYDAGSVGAVTANHELVNFDHFQADLLNAVQCHVWLDKVFTLSADGVFACNGVEMKYDTMEHDGMKREITRFIAFRMIDYERCVAISRMGELAVFNMREIQDGVLKHIEHFRILSGYRCALLDSERQQEFEITEQSRKLEEAMNLVYDWREGEVTKAIREIDNEINEEQKRLEYWKALQSKYSSGLWMLIKKDKYLEAAKNHGKHAATIHKLEDTKASLRAWKGPFFPNPSQVKDQKCQFCGNQRNLICTDRDCNGYYAFACVSCVVKKDIYCAVCGNIDANHTGIHSDSECYICKDCLENSQGRQSVTKGVVGKCAACGATRVPLWLSKDRLLCDCCRNR